MVDIYKIIACPVCKCANFDIYPHWNTHIAGDAHNLPLIENSIDIVWLCAVLEHIRQPFIVLDEVHRILKTDGSF